MDVHCLDLLWLGFICDRTRYFIFPRKWVIFDTHPEIDLLHLSEIGHDTGGTMAPVETHWFVISSVPPHGVTMVFYSPWWTIETRSFSGLTEHGSIPEMTIDTRALDGFTIKHSCNLWIHWYPRTFMDTYQIWAYTRNTIYIYIEKIYIYIYIYYAISWMLG